MVLYQIYFQYCARALAKGGGGSFNYFKFGTFIGRFPSDAAASMAVEGLSLYVFGSCFRVLAVLVSMIFFFLSVEPPQYFKIRGRWGGGGGGG